MSQTSTLKDQCIAEFFGARLLILFGVDCAAALEATGASFGQWEISVIWELEVVVAIYLVIGVSGAHLNPTVTIVLWLFACFDKRKIVPFIVSQVVGVFYAAALVYELCYSLFFDSERAHHIVRDSVEGVDLADIFSTYLNPHINSAQTFVVEVVITAILTGLILALTDDDNGVSRGPLAPLLIGLLIVVTGASIGPLAGFAADPARDSDPRVFAWLMDQGDIASTGDRDILCFLVPLFGPIVGATVGAFAYHRLIGRHLLYDTCVVREREITTPSEQKVSLQYNYGAIRHN